MREKDLHKIIRDDAENNAALERALKQRHPELKSDTAQPRKHARKRLVVVFAPLTAAAVLALVLIPTILLSGGDLSDLPNGSDASHAPSSDFEDASPQSPNSGVQDGAPNAANGTPGDSSAASRDYQPIIQGYALQDYNVIHNTSFLCFDFPAADNTLVEYRNTITQAVLGLQVSLIDATSGDNIQYVICADPSRLDFLEYNISVCKNEQNVNGYQVKWGEVNNNAYGIFDYGNYGYYVTLKNNNRSRLFELIQQLIKDR